MERKEFEFKPITIESFAYVGAKIQNEQITEYGITPVCLYAPYDRAEFCDLGDLVLVRFVENGVTSFGLFGNLHTPTIHHIIDGLYSRYGSFAISYLSLADKDYLQSVLTDYVTTVRSDPDQSDYLYNYEDFLNTSGNRVKHKREALTNFYTQRQYRFEQMTADSRADALRVMDKWCARKDCSQCEYCCEKDIVVALFDKWELFPVRGGLLYVDDEPEAFFIGEKVGDTLIGYHQKTATTEIKGLSYAIYTLSVEKLFSDCKYVNIGPDIGVAGLRQFKQQFKPYTMLDKYTVEVTARV